MTGAGGAGDLLVESVGVFATKRLMRIAIIGAGNVGSALGRGWSSARRGCYLRRPEPRGSEIRFPPKGAAWHTGGSSTKRKCRRIGDAVAGDGGSNEGPRRSCRQGHHR